MVIQNNGPSFNIKTVLNRMFQNIPSTALRTAKSAEHSDPTLSQEDLDEIVHNMVATTRIIDDDQVVSLIKQMLNSLHASDEVNSHDPKEERKVKTCLNHSVDVDFLL